MQIELDLTTQAFYAGVGAGNATHQPDAEQWPLTTRLAFYWLSIGRRCAVFEVDNDVPADRLADVQAAFLRGASTQAPQEKEGLFVLTIDTEVLEPTGEIPAPVSAVLRKFSNAYDDASFGDHGSVYADVEGRAIKVGEWRA